MALSSDAPLLAFRDRRPRWVHYGSSISQGSNAAGPSQSWVAVAARALGRRPAQPRPQRERAGGPVRGPDHPRPARRRHQPRAGHQHREPGLHGGAHLLVGRARLPRHGPRRPLGHADPRRLALLLPHHEQTPGPGSLDAEALARGRLLFLATGRPGPGKITLEATRELLSEVVARRDDPNLHLIDGLDLYGPDDLAELPMVDQLHPDTEAHDRIGRRFAERVFPAAERIDHQLGRTGSAVPVRAG